MNKAKQKAGVQKTAIIPPIRPFGQDCAEDLLRIFGKAATCTELHDFMMQRYGPVITHEMLQNALRKGVKAERFSVVKNPDKKSCPHASGPHRYALTNNP